MQLSKLIARIASVVYLSASLGAFFSTDYYRKIAEDLFSNSALTYVTGFITVIIGFFIVTYHNTWAKSWIVLITILGWLAIIKGICLIAFPQFVRTLSERMLTDSSAKIFPYAALCLGLFFAYFGFVSPAPPDKSSQPISGG
jgi:uncharacterized membrane protein HdeD (DUF308 family)